MTGIEDEKEEKKYSVHILLNVGSSQKKTICEKIKEKNESKTFSVVKYSSINKPGLSCLSDKVYELHFLLKVFFSFFHTFSFGFWILLGLDSGTDRIHCHYILNSYN